MIKKNKNILIFLGVCIVLIVSMFFVFNKSHEYKELPKVKVKEQKNLKQFALMLEQDNGEYKESTGEFPTEGYAFNHEKSGCTDINGKIIDGALNYDYETYTVLVDTNKTSYCYLYYDQEPNIGYLRSKDNNSKLTKELTGGMYRYQGTDDVANWICFGTSNQDECKSDIDKYMYRIIGINAKGELYLLKETFLKEGSVSGFAWNDEYLFEGSGVDLCKNGICPEWNKADLFQRINGTANGTNPGDGNANDGVDNDTDIFVDSEYYDYLKSGDKINGGENASDWYKLIQTHSWYYGDTTIHTYDGNLLFAIETGKSESSHNILKGDGTIESQTYKWTNKVDSKINLMYIHDYAFAYPEGNAENHDNMKSTWIHFQKDEYNIIPEYEWFSTRYGIYSSSETHVSARYVFNVGYLDGIWWYLSAGNGVRPVFYISNKINLSGNGTKENPFMIN